MFRKQCLKNFKHLNTQRRLGLQESYNQVIIVDIAHLLTQGLYFST